MFETLKEILSSIQVENQLEYPSEIKENLAVGVEYPCKKKPSKKRSHVLKAMNIGDPVKFEFYFYKLSPAYLLIDEKTGLDFGNLSQVVAESIYSRYPKAKIVGEIADFYDGSAHVQYKIYGDGVFDRISRRQVDMLYSSYKQGDLQVSQDLFRKAYALSGAETVPRKDIKFVSALRNAVTDISNENYEKATERLKRFDV